MYTVPIVYVPHTYQSDHSTHELPSRLATMFRIHSKIDIGEINLLAY